MNIWRAIIFVTVGVFAGYVFVTGVHCGSKSRDAKIKKLAKAADAKGTKAIKKAKAVEGKVTVNKTAISTNKTAISINKNAIAKYNKAIRNLRWRQRKAAKALKATVAAEKEARKKLRRDMATGFKKAGKSFKKLGKWTAKKLKAQRKSAVKAHRVHQKWAEGRFKANRKWAKAEHKKIRKDFGDWDLPAATTHRASGSLPPITVEISVE